MAGACEGRVTLDLGTGSGRYVVARARTERERLFIGLDANRAGLVEPSRRAAAKPERGGVTNAAFVHAALEALPGPLDGIADEVTVLFPWGSLLRAVAAPDPALLASIRETCRPGASFRAVFSLAERDAAELNRLGVGELDAAVLSAEYEAAGFSGFELSRLTAPEVGRLGTAWTRRLARTGSAREVWEVRARTR